MNITAATLEVLKSQMNSASFDPAALAKAITQSTGLVAIDLEAPSKKLYPVLSPMRNDYIGRFADGKGGTAVQWRGVLAQGPSAGPAPVAYQVGVAEGQRNAGWNLSTANYSATYKGIGLEQSVTFEADYAGQTFEDMKGLAVLVNLQALMVKEEQMLFGGNTSISLGVTPNPTLSTAATGGTIPSATNVVVSVVYLSYEGLQASTVSGGVVTTFTRTNADSTTTTSGYGAAQINASAQTQATGGSTQTNTVTATVAMKAGAIGYAWFWGPTAGAAQTLGAITTVNSVVITTATGTGTQTAANATLTGGDNSADPLSFDGILSLGLGLGQQIGNAASIGYNKAFTSGYTLTSDGGGGIVEIDAMLKDRWDNYRLGFDTLWVNSQEATSITKLIVANGGAPLVRFAGEINGQGRQAIGGGTFVNSYLNKYTGELMRIVIHPYAPAGLILATAKKLPYPVNNVNEVFQVRTRRDYYEIDWPIVSRSYPYGLYADEVLINYFQAGIGVLSNLSPN